MNRREFFSLIAAVPLAAIAPQADRWTEFGSYRINLSARVDEIMHRMYADHFARLFSLTKAGREALVLALQKRAARQGGSWRGGSWHF